MMKKLSLIIVVLGLVLLVCLIGNEEEENFKDQK